MLMQIMNKKFFIIIFIIGASFFLSPYLSCNFFSGISSTSDTLEILVVREDGIEDDKFELFKKHFFLPQRNLPKFLLPINLNLFWTNFFY